MKIAPALILTVCLLLQLSAPSLAADRLTQGIRLFNTGQYAQAAQYLKRAVASQPFNQKAQYFLGDSLSHLNDKQGAMRSYEGCFRADPFSSFGIKAKKALLGLSANNSPTAVANPVAAGSEHRPDDANTIRQAILTMHRQSDDAERRVRQEGETLAKAQTKHAQVQVSNIYAQAQQDESELVAIGGRRMFQAEIYQINLQARYAEARARQEAQILASQKRNFAAQRAVALNEAAANLEAQLAEPKRPGHIRLKASGTNLYVRNYESDTEVPVELVATQSLVATGAQSNIRSRAVGTVSGRLLKSQVRSD
jgi:hypothetical protein